MSQLTNIFKAYDVRGKVGSELNADVALRIGKAFGQWLPEKGVVAVGRDMRPDSAELANALIDGLRSQERDVWDIGEVTSDMIYFSAGHFGLAGGVMITASHNPGEYNGIKFCREEAKPVGIETGLFEVRDLAEANKFNDKPLGKLVEKDVCGEWIKHVLSFVEMKNLRPLKLVVDAGNGMAGKIFPYLEKHVPFVITEMYFELDGTFPNHIANPLERKNIEDLIAQISTEKADVGLAFDGDGDRAVLIDEKGEPLSGTVMTALLADYLLEKNPGQTVLYNATCGWVVPETIERHNGEAIRTKIGHSYIKQDMRTHGALMAGESSGHYYFKDNFMADSGLIAAVIALGALSESGKSLSELAAKYRKYHQILETNFAVEDKQGAITAVRETFPEAKSDNLDGLTLYIEDAWVNVRPSNTESLLRLNAEAKSQSSLENVVSKVTAVIQQY